MINKGFLDALFEFIRSVESELDIMLPQSSSLQFLSNNKVTDHLITQRLGKNVIIRLLCTFDENTTETIKKLVPFIGYKSIKLSSPITEVGSLVLEISKIFFLFQLMHYKMIKIINMILRIEKKEIIFFLLMIGYIQRTSL